MLCEADRKVLLNEAREAMAAAVCGEHPPVFSLASFSEVLQSPGASFVTLTKMGDLRGCIGAIEPYQPLVLDVREHAVAAALHDFRFPPVSKDELQQIEIEISRLTVPQPVVYSDPRDLLNKIQPHVDGVIIRSGFRRATFLPQVWMKIPEPDQFLNHLCIKLGVSSDWWCHNLLDVSVYQVEEFRE